MPAIIPCSYTKPIPADATPTTLRGKPAVRFKGSDGRTQTALLTKNGKRIRLFTGTFKGKFTDATGKPRVVVIRAANGRPCRNKAAAAALLNEIIEADKRAAAGLADPLAVHRQTALADHLADFRAHLKAEGDTKKHVNQKIGRIRRTLDACGFRLIADLDACKLEKYVTELQDKGRQLPPLPDGGEPLTRTEAAAALGIKPDGLSKLVRRHDLAAVGNGKARRYPRETVQFLRDRAARGISGVTAAYYKSLMKSFTAWMVDDRRLATDDDPFAHLKVSLPEDDLRQDRRSFTLSELRLIIAAAERSNRTVCDLSGPDRSMLYAVASASGFRAAELASLTPAAFALDGTPPTVTLRAADDKRGKAVVQPLQPETVERLRAYLTGRPSDRPVWPGKWYEKAADMLRVDLAAAEVPFVIDGPNGPQHAHFHSFRHTTCAMLDAAGVSLKQAMTHMRHSDPKLTLKRYGRATLAEQGVVAEKLPSFLAPDLAPPAATGCAPMRPHGAPAASDHKANSFPAAPITRQNEGFATLCDSLTRLAPTASDRPTSAVGGLHKPRVTGSNPVAATVPKRC
jgi:integrase